MSTKAGELQFVPFPQIVQARPGVRLNIGKRGLGVSAGVRGARASISTRGRSTSGSVPGTGASYRRTSWWKRRR